MLEQCSVVRREGIERKERRSKVGLHGRGELEAESVHSCGMTCSVETRPFCMR